MAFIPGIASIELLKMALGERGYTTQGLILNGRSFTVFTSPRGKVWCTSNAHIQYPFPTSTARPISDSKILAYELADQLGIQYPKTVYVTDENTETPGIEDLMANGPVIVKPNNASLARGLTLNITDKITLKKAIDEAKVFSKAALVQEQVSGEEVRLAIINGQVVAALVRQTPRVIGDGQSNLETLIARENEQRRQLDLRFSTYPDLDASIIDFSRFTMEHIPAQGEVIELGSSAMIRYGASLFNISDTLHQSYKDEAVRLAEVLGDGFVVVDMFVQDYRQPAEKDNYHFIEFNMSPILVLFYSCRDGNNYDILAKLAPMIDIRLHQEGQDD
ncbi:MAG TPA: hypothetical protein VK983_02815 [Candidatus Limnocylindrales bacterium]|nr:hypothetical protein [Candidatus Limnocylindrales bacterium]